MGNPKNWEGIRFADQEMPKAELSCPGNNSIAHQTYSNLSSGERSEHELVDDIENLVV